ncbi:regulatory protein, Fis family [Desulfonauticus submarinus]|uniref:Regulatory protein, Fis family n=1 Tax=Desulfonauticus submarinus TaxID=206665 RepID=A0A1H0DIK5_9BACT|nr:sigma-54 dependent transcriptional regulator [Desulfonauticus submarinus]SDN69953.1 regulatory protein, Fis family [Desulfonauticus submarinus]
MKKFLRKKIFISPEILISFIVGGIGFLFFIISIYIQKYHVSFKLAAAFVVFLVMFFLTLSLIKLLLKPIDEFVEKVSPFISKEKKEVERIKQDLKYEPIFNHAYGVVTKAISLVETKKFFPDIICQSKVMRQVLQQVLTVAPTDSTVLILGESGTGKELIAEHLHKLSARHNGPLIKINCAALPKDLIESELFGYEKGAFTGAIKSKPGKFELAHKGTLFLDEIGDLPLELQGKLLRVLEDKRVERLGGKHPKKIDIRIIAATNKSLEQMIKKGTFREDLFFRLNVFPIHLPPLRKRKEDIPILAEFFLKKHFPEKKLLPETLAHLLNYSWPGNIRELFNVLERAALSSSNNIISPESLPFINKETISTPINLTTPLNLDQKLQEIEKHLILNALYQTKGIQRKAAKILGIKERSLWHRIKKYNLDPNQFK